MKRRSFIRSLLLAGASCTILPGAGRIWKVQTILPASNLLCFDKELSVTSAEEQLRQIIDEITRPTTMRAWNEFLYTQAARYTTPTT